MKGFPLISIAIFILLACTACNGKRYDEMARVSQQKDSIILNQIHTYIDSLWNKKDTTFLKSLSDRGFERNLNGIEVANTPREMQSHLNVFFTAFPDLKISLEEAHIQDGKAFIQWSASGTNTGVFGEVGPTGKKVKVNGVSHIYFNQDGKLYREFVFFNELDLLQQLGYTLVPPILQ